MLHSDVDPSEDAAVRPVGTEEEKEKEEEEKVFAVPLSSTKGTFTHTKTAYDEMFSKLISPHAITQKRKNNGFEAKRKNKTRRLINIPCLRNESTNYNSAPLNISDFFSPLMF